MRGSTNELANTPSGSKQEPLPPLSIDVIRSAASVVMTHYLNSLSECPTDDHRQQLCEKTLSALRGLVEECQPSPIPKEISIYMTSIQKCLPKLNAETTPGGPDIDVAPEDNTKILAAAQAVWHFHNIRRVDQPSIGIQALQKMCQDNMKVFYILAKRCKRPSLEYEEIIDYFNTLQKELGELNNH